MKKLFIVPVFLVCITGASPNKVETPIKMQLVDKPQISIKVDSLNSKAEELNKLIREQ